MVRVEEDEKAVIFTDLPFDFTQLSGDRRTQRASGFKEHKLGAMKRITLN